MSYRSHISFYSQTSPIVAGNILENLNFGRTPVPLENYTQLAFLDKFLKNGEGAQTAVVENGNNLSGGDKQRLAIARAFCENSDVLILDEPTNSLDKETEEVILKSLFEKKKDKIIFYITHDSDNLRFCNRVFEVTNKMLVEIK